MAEVGPSRHHGAMDAQAVERSTNTVAAFALRARRVAAHSLVQDAAMLDRIAGGGFVVRRKDGALSMERALPKEELLESLAARVRPLTLQSEGIHYTKVFKSLAVLLDHHGANEHLDWTNRLKSEWKSVDPKSDNPTYFHQTWSDTTQPVEATDAALTLAWFYGDLVHADEKSLHTGDRFSIEDRFSAAAVRTAQLATLTRDTLSWIQWLVEHEHLDPTALGNPDEHVIVTPSKTRTLTGIYIGEVPDGDTAKLEPGADPATIGMTTGGAPWHDTTDDGAWTITIPWGSDI